MTPSRISSATYAIRRAIVEDSDRRQERVVIAAKRSGFAFDWPAILRDARTPDEIGAEIEARLRDESFTRTIETLGTNGRLLAAYVQRRHEQLAGIRKPETSALVFAEEESFTPEAALKRWRQLLDITDEELQDFLANRLPSFQKEVVAMRGRISRKLFDAVAKIYEQTISEGLGLADYIDLIADKLPDLSASELETEYTTNIARVYSEARDELVLERASTFPFQQFMALKDSRTTWWICLPMGMAGPNGSGYIAATDDPIWLTWRTPCHYRCRSQRSPISYLEAQRLGILASDGQTKIARVGSNPSRPFGDPPQFAEDPDTGTIRGVEPQPGFGG